MSKIVKYLRIGEVSKLLGEDPYVIRFWEKKFHLVPLRSKTHQRRYNPNHVAKLQLIRYLLRKQGFTIKGAKSQIYKLTHFSSGDGKENVLSGTEDSRPLL